MREILGVDGQPVTSEQQSFENIKESIVTIEGLFFAVNNSNMPLRFAEAALKGMSFLNQMHTQLMGQLPAEEIEKMRAQHKTNIPPIPAAPTPAVPAA